VAISAFNLVMGGQMGVQNNVPDRISGLSEIAHDEDSDALPVLRHQGSSFFNPFESAVGATMIE
jgi:hypothetical protein